MQSQTQLHSELTELIRQEIITSNPEGSPEATAALVSHIRRGNATAVLEVIREHFKYNPASTQVRMMTVMDQCLINSGPQFAVLLSSEKWTERFFKVAKTDSVQVRDKIITTLISWYKRHHTSGHQRLLHRFSQSKTLGAPFQNLICQYEQRQASRNQNSMVRNFDNMEDSNPNQVLAMEETLLLQFQGDLASLEYALEHPHILQDDDIAKECQQHKLKCMQMLATDDHSRISPELMSLIDRFSDALELYEAMTGTDLGEGLAARQRAVDDEMAEPDSDDDAQQRLLRRRAAAKADVGQVMLEAQQQTQQLVDQERMELVQLRQNLEDLRRQHEDLQNKYKDAKAKNRKAVSALEQMADQIQNMQGGGGEADGVAAGAMMAALPAFMAGGGKGAQISAITAERMRDDVQAARQGLRQIREHLSADIVRESKYYSTQLSTAMAAIVRASIADREADQKALQWTQELYKKELKLRKQYYNTIQELKGNIRVYCRVRPMLPIELNGGHKNIMTFPSTDELMFTDSAGRPKLFEFDEVYRPEDPQSKVFEDTAPLIDSVVDGFNVCIFAYGQTGSGKTFTMGGGSGEDKGINTRALERLFKIIEERRETEESTVTLSVLEIYIEQIRDLLVSKREASGINYDVKQGGPCGTYVTNLKEVPVSSPNDIYSIMKIAEGNRSEGMTNMNEHSSRSHMLLYIIVRTTNKQTHMQSYGKLSLVDLAGSERLDKSGAEGQRQKEAVAINKSLSALGDVISSLSQNAKHVPFRNSVLTFLLQDSMAGQAKVLMFVCVSPASYNASESGSSLLFASRARGIAFGQIKKNAAVAKE